jgi:hypothetical protein
MNIKIMVVWDVTQCILVDRRFRGTWCVHFQIISEDGSSRFLRNVNTYLPYCTASYSVKGKGKVVPVLN